MFRVTPKADIWAGARPRKPLRFSSSPLREGEGNVWYLISPPPERRLALLDEGFCRLAMVLGLGAAHVIHGFGVEHGLDRRTLRRVDVLLDVPECDAGALRQRHRELLCGRLELRVRYHPGDEPQRQRLVRHQDRRGEVKLPRLGAAAEAGHA